MLLRHIRTQDHLTRASSLSRAVKHAEKRHNSQTIHQSQKKRGVYCSQPPSHKYARQNLLPHYKSFNQPCIFAADSKSSRVRFIGPMDHPSTMKPRRRGTRRIYFTIRVSPFANMKTDLWQGYSAIWTRVGYTRFGRHRIPHLLQRRPQATQNDILPQCIMIFPTQILTGIARVDTVNPLNELASMAHRIPQRISVRVCLW